jgi:small conductance mechanosensitive channel
MEEQLQSLDQVSATVIDLAVRFGPRVLVAVAFIVAGYVAGGWAARAAGRALARLHMEAPVRLLLERIVRLLVLSLFLVMALQNLGVELLPLIAGLGVAGAGIALAMQGVLGNVVAGLSIIFTKPFRVGDYISIVTEEGEVLEIQLFTTTLGHADLSRVVIPNRKIVGEILHNFGTIRQIQTEVGVSYDADVQAAIATIREVLIDNPRVRQDPRPVVGVTRLADSCVVIGVKPWVNAPDFAAVSGEINQAILEAFRERSIVIPFPQREVRVVGRQALLAQ